MKENPKFSDADNRNGVYKTDDLGYNESRIHVSDWQGKHIAAVRMLQDNMLSGV